MYIFREHKKVAESTQWIGLIVSCFILIVVCHDKVDSVSLNSSRRAKMYCYLFERESPESFKENMLNTLCYVHGLEMESSYPAYLVM